MNQGHGRARRARQRRAASLISLLLLASCDEASVPPETPASLTTVGVPGATERTPLGGAGQRPDIVRSFAVDYAALPFLVSTPLVPRDEDAELSIVNAGNGPSGGQVGGDLIVEIELSGMRAFTEPQPRPPGPCTSRPGTAPVSWEGFHLAAWTDSYIEYVRYEGTFDFATCRAKPTRAAKVRAPALVPQLVYGFRTCVPVCAVPPKEGSSEELLVLITPPARWVGASVPWPKMQTQPHVGTFSRIIVPMKRGGSASALFNLAKADIDSFRARRSPPGKTPLDVLDAPVIQVSFDFSWLEVDPLPVGMGYIGEAKTSSTGRYQYDFSDSPLESVSVTP